ncbi:hypothetical protein R5W24_004420 [Gemmata sp. JC717]|uniref:hypothetical protein n=1 Tax=Gemmata algarum TaxID=2975278 RepID=UPI0021BB7FB2|nr:hypothetical protein [Gemmata algarum]MDY3555279.1 hypothetical protein [Gemmata algarum]
MKLLSSLRSAVSSALGRASHHKSLGRAQVGGDASRPTVEALIWVLVDNEGRYVADADPEALIDEYALQVGAPTFGRPVQLVKLTATIPLPRPIVMQATVSG